MNFLKKYKLTVIGALTGAAGGYAYYYFVGCSSGSCPITSKPLNSILYGALMGGLLLNAFESKNNPRTTQTNNKMNVSNIIKEKKGSILDVRTHAEYAGGHAADSKNIPLQEIAARMDEVKGLKQPIVLCCASGARSEQATQFLRAQGIDCVNAGSWLDVNYLQSH